LGPSDVSAGELPTVLPAVDLVVSCGVDSRSPDAPGGSPARSKSCPRRLGNSAVKGALVQTRRDGARYLARGSAIGGLRAGGRRRSSAARSRSPG